MKASEAENNIASNEILKLCHDRLGHINFGAVHEATKKILERIWVDDGKNIFCEACQFGK